MCAHVCSERYRENGNPDTAGMVIEKAAKSVPSFCNHGELSCHCCRTMEHSEPGKAAELYLEVANVHDVSSLTLLLECFVV